MKIIIQAELNSVQAQAGGKKSDETKKKDESKDSENITKPDAASDNVNVTEKVIQDVCM